MDPERLIAQLLADPPRIDLLHEPLPDTVAATVVAHLKQEADRHYWINANRSLALGDLIATIGRVRDDAEQLALGSMTRADSLRFLGQLQTAWDLFAEAGNLFRGASNEIGWARTRIGRLLCCVELNHVDEALADAERARELFERHGERERLLSLLNNTAIVYNHIGQYRRALAICDRAFEIAQHMGPQGRHYLGMLYIDAGFAHHLLGDLRQAAWSYSQARTISEQLGEIRGVALAEVNTAHIAMSQGYHKQALRLLHHACTLYEAEALPLDATHANHDVIQCYLALNRYIEARDLALHVQTQYRAFGAAYQEAHVLLHLATAEAALGNLGAAHEALDTAVSIFAALDASTWVATADLRRGQIANKTQDWPLAAALAQKASEIFETAGRQVEYAAAQLVFAEALLTKGDLIASAMQSGVALRIAQNHNVPLLRYNAYVLLGHSAVAQGNVERARRYYGAAIATVERVQRGLSITLRPGFLEDKNEALAALIGLYLETNDVTGAFKTLERAKAQALLSYLNNREQFRWASNDPRSRELIHELNQLREEHHWYYELAHNPSGDNHEYRPVIDPQQARHEVAIRERRMRAITEQLYLYTDEHNGSTIDSVPSVPDIQRHLAETSLLIEFYNDGTNVWAFTIDHQTINLHQLPVSVRDIDRLLAQLQLNIDTALRAGPHGPTSQSVSSLGRRILQRLYMGLLAPLAARLTNRTRLIIVPYGALHYIPFHLLHDDSSYVLESYEVVILPAAALVTRGVTARRGGALAIAHSWNGRLPQTNAEARIVQHTFGGTLRHEVTATRDVFATPPTKVLHIAAHGEHRLDQPDLSYIQLADGQLYTDDLLQHDLSYELVTLSACETGRAHIASGDELIGVGRGFLYAGAATLITSLWSVADDITIELMERLYSALARGESKVAALQHAQQAVITTHPQLHPAYWGAFQLVGNAEPLSRTG
jgi:CHAT domain-containing protein/tetratricopeptide (TPR) repeat protein